MNRRTLRRAARLTALTLALTLLFLLVIGLIGQEGQTARAQASTTTPTAVEEAPGDTVTATPGAAAPLSDTVTGTVTPASTANITQPAAVPVTVTVVVTVTAVATPTPTPTAGPPVVPLPEDEVLRGTIIANRTPYQAMFFLEGALYELPPHRATGLDLARPLTALTLYNCEESNTDPETCFWDPYPLRKDGFYEIRNSSEEGQPVTLILVEAAPPPVDQAWIQNRTGHREQVLVGDALQDLSNTEVMEVPVAEPGGGEVHLRRCLETGQQQVCEWPAFPIKGGVYYALASTSAPADAPGATLVSVSLEPVVLRPELLTPTPTPTPQPQGLFCQSQVPALNVRSGPGLEYLVIGKVRLSDASGGRVFVVGRNETNEWLAVDSQVVDGGWIVNFPRFLTCEGDTAELPIAPVTDGRLAAPTATPTPPPESETSPAQTPAAEAAPQEPEGIPPGRALLIVTNAFEYEVRFTLDAAQHGLPEGSPSEYDLQPGQSMRFLIYPGRVQFSASTPFRGSSGNGEFVIKEGATRELFLHFVPSVDNPKRWEMRYE